MLEAEAIRAPLTSLRRFVKVNLVRWNSGSRITRIRFRIHARVTWEQVREVEKPTRRPGHATQGFE